MTYDDLLDELNIARSSLDRIERTLTLRIRNLEESLQKERETVSRHRKLIRRLREALNEQHQIDTPRD